MVCLALVPEDEVDAAYWLLVDESPNYGEKIKDFTNYVLETWIMNSTYPVCVWNQYNNKGPRTNNHVEGFNSKINNFFFLLKVLFFIYNLL